MKTRKSLLLTGATGYLGSEIAKALVARNYSVVALKRAASDTTRLKTIQPQLSLYDVEDGLEGLFCSHQFDGIIHCAANYGREGQGTEDIVRTNLLLPLELLLEGLQRGIRYFINTGTLLNRATNDYSLSKAHFQDWLQVKSTSITSVTLELEHFYGFDGDSTKFITWLVRGILTNQDIPLTEGEQMRDFLFISDVVSAFMIVLENIEHLSHGHHSFQVGSGRSTSIRDLVNQVSLLCEPHSAAFRWGAIPYRATECTVPQIDIEPLTRLGWTPCVSLTEGLQRTVAAIKESDRNRV